MGKFTRILFFVMCIGQFSFAQTEYVSLDQVRKVADQKALTLWGNVSSSEPLAYYSKDDELIGYRFTYAINQQFPGKELLLKQCREAFKQSDHKAQWGLEEYGNIFVSARKDIAVIQDYSKALAPEYVFGSLMREKAREQLGGAVTLKRAYYINFPNQWFCYSNGKDEVYVKVFPETRVVNREEFHRIVDGKSFFCAQGDFSGEWAQYQGGQMDAPTGQVWIPNHDGNCKFYDWSYGCSPTAAAMLLSYWDYLSSISSNNYSKLVDYYFQRWDGIQGETDYQVPNTNKELAIAMHTDTVVEGGTDRDDIAPGYTAVCNTTNGYNFTCTSHDHGTDVVWYFDKIVSEVGTYDRPIHISIPDHSECCVAYDLNTNMIGVHNTWNEGVQWISRTQLQRVYTIVPGGAQGYAIELTCPMGDVLYNHNGSGETLYAGGVAEIRWNYDYAFNSYVRIYYSTNGGYNWSAITYDTPNDGVYDWVIPSGINSTTCRIRVMCHSSADVFSGSDASIGNLKILPGGSIQELSADLYVNAGTDPDYFQFTSTTGYWNVVGVRPNTSGDDWDAYLYGDLGFGTLLASSEDGGSAVDFVVVDGNHAPSAARGIKVNRYSGSGTGRVEWEGGADIVTVASPINETWSAGDVVEMWDAYLIPGYYKCTMLVNSGNADLGMGLYGSPDAEYYAGKPNYLAMADSYGAGAGESFWVTISTADYYGLCIFANDVYSANITVKFETPGQWLGSISNDWFTAGNWSAAFVPESATDVTISPGYTNYPIISSGTANCNNITIEAGARISIGSANLNVAGNMTINGEAEQTHYNADFNVTGSVYWKPGSTANITDDGEFHVSGDWEFWDGASAVLANGYVYFEGESAYSYIRNHEASCAFNNVLNRKTAGYLYFSSTSTDTLKINGYYDNVNPVSLFYFNTNYPLVLKGQLYNYGHIYCRLGTFIFDGTAHNVNLNTGDYFNNIIISSTGNVSMLDSLRVKGDLSISSGALVTNNFPVIIEGSWDNQVGTSGFNEGTGIVLFNGAADSDITTGETFYDLYMEKSNDNNTALELTYGMTLNILNNLYLYDGSFELNGNTTLNVSNDLGIALGAGLNANDTPLITINVSGNWLNYNFDHSITNGFDPGSSSVVTFIGTVDQYLYTNCPQEEFNDLKINKSSGKFGPLDNIQCARDILILNGTWEDLVTGLAHSLYRDFTVSSAGAFLNAAYQNTVEFLGARNSLLTYSGATGSFHNLIINKSPGYAVTQVGHTSCQSDGNLTVENGGYNMNGYTLSVFGNVAVNDAGVLYLPPASMLILSDTKSLNVNSGGLLEIAGTSGSNATIQANLTASRYGFTVYPGGAIAADYCIFKNMNGNGLYVQSGATVDPAHAFKGCTFQDGSNALLIIDNNQPLTIHDAVFPVNTWGGNYNVAKTINQGHLYFVDYSGGFSGESHEYDPFALIDWVPALTATATATPAAICPGSSSQLNVNRTGGMPAYSYHWSPSTGLSNSNIIDPVASPASSIIYYVTVTDGLGTTASSSVNVTVLPVLPVSVTISASANPSPPGSSVTFTAVPVNGGASPSCQWKVNGTIVGSSPTYSYVPSYGDEVICILTSNYPCPSGNPATSNTITMIVVPVNISVNGTIPGGPPVCIDASGTITVAGGGTTFHVNNGGGATLIAGYRISILPTTIVDPGGYMHGYITTTNDYCGSLAKGIVSVVTGEEEFNAVPVPDSQIFTIFPNPTTGTFTIQNRSAITTGKVEIEIYNMRGDRIYATSYTDERSHLFTLTGLPPGLHLVKVISGDKVESFKLIVTR
jgi:hypothetical protein